MTETHLQNPGLTILCVCFFELSQHDFTNYEFPNDSFFFNKIQAVFMPEAENLRFLNIFYLFN